MSALSHEDLKIAISRALGPDTMIVDHSLEPYSKLKDAFLTLGDHHLLTVHTQQSGSDENIREESHTFFVKTLSDSTLKDVLVDAGMFMDECNYYMRVDPLMTRNCKGERWSPRCYLVTCDAIVLEDLRAQGFTTLSDMLLGEEAIKVALACLARFHASSLITEKKSGKSLQEAFPHAFAEKSFSDHSKFGKSVLVGFDTIGKTIEKFGMDSSLVPKIRERVWQLVRAREGECNVLCHGDVWKNNLLFKRDATALKCIMIHYQLLRWASPTVDVVMLLYLHTTPEYRKKSELELFEYYYRSLRDTLQQSDVEPEIPSRESILKDYQERRLLGMVMAFLYLDGLHLPPDVLEKIASSPEEMAKWFLGNRFDTVGFYLDADPVYREKMKSMVIELLEEAESVFRV